MMKKYWILLLAFNCIGIVAEAQESPVKNTVYNRDFKWTITIPEGFDTVSAAQWIIMQHRGQEAIEKATDVKVENNAHTIFVFQSNQFNYFESNHQPFDTAVDGSYAESFKEVNNMVYTTFKSQMPDAEFDSVYMKQLIDGLDFYTYKLSVTVPGKMVLNWLMFSRLFDKREFTVNIMTVDRQKEKELLHSWLNSKFER